MEKVSDLPNITELVAQVPYPLCKMMYTTALIPTSHQLHSSGSSGQNTAAGRGEDVRLQYPGVDKNNGRSLKSRQSSVSKDGAMSHQ